MAKTTSLPAGFVSLFCVYMSDELLISTVGRVALILSLLSLATISLEIFRSGGPIAKALVHGEDTPWVRWGYRVGAGALVIVPLVLAFVSAIGFHYTATRLSTRMAATWGAIALLVALRGVALRWLTIVAGSLSNGPRSVVPRFNKPVSPQSNKQGSPRFNKPGSPQSNKQGSPHPTPRSTRTPAATRRSKPTCRMSTAKANG
jgi:hypothetical protein